MDGQMRRLTTLETTSALLFIPSNRASEITACSSILQYVNLLVVSTQHTYTTSFIKVT